MRVTLSRQMVMGALAVATGALITCTTPGGGGKQKGTLGKVAATTATAPATTRGGGRGGQAGGRGGFGRGGFGRGGGGRGAVRPELPFYDTELSVDERIDDLLSRLTLEEKAAQMQMAAPAIDRFGIVAYHWWSEALHGVARNNEATVFPQAIGMAASWNTDLHYQMARVIAVEARAKHDEAVRQGIRAIYTGLDLWSPNINIFRDPRWGRGQETYGEDPYLTGRFGVAFVTGLQGNDPFYFQTIATPKHYAVHSGPEPERHRFDVSPGDIDLRTTYLPAFEACVREGKAFSVMAAYNSVDGLPCAANPRLLTDILRKEWGFEGYVTSDVDSVRDVYQSHQTAGTPEEAAAISVKAGCDLNGGTTYQALAGAVRLGLLTEADLDKSLRRLFTARMRLGEFDPVPVAGVAIKNPYANTPPTANDTKEHDAVALQMARQSMVLLKNANGVLPLKKNLGSIAVIGPTADSLPALVGNYNGTPSHPVTILQGIRNEVPLATKVLYSQGCPLVTEDVPLAEPVPAACFYTDETHRVHGLYASYYRNYVSADRPLRTRIDATIDLAFPDRAAKDLLPFNEGFYTKWTGVLVPPETGDYQLGFSGKDAWRLYVDGKLVVDEFYTNPKRSAGNAIHLEKDHNYVIMAEYYHPPFTGGGGARGGGGGGAATQAGGGGAGAAGGRGGAGAGANVGEGAASQPATEPAEAAAPPTPAPRGGRGGGGAAVVANVPATGAPGSGLGTMPMTSLPAANTRDELTIQMRWTRPATGGLAGGVDGLNLYNEALQAARAADAVVLVLGITADLEREEHAIHYAGFDGGDRTSLDLPAVQEHLLEQVTAAAGNKPVILVLTNGSAISVNWANEHVPGILEAWYPGQHGDAVADVLLGNYNPAGRLPVTFYKSASDLPPFAEYGMQSGAGRTYRYFTGESLYPFGYGLSYTKFDYSDLQVSEQPTTAANLSAHVTVKNSGPVAGEEVVQLYLDRPAPMEGFVAPRTADDIAAMRAPRKQLVGFLRVPLAPGESKTVQFTLTPQQLSTVDEGGKRLSRPGKITLQAGGSSVGALQKEVTIGGEAAAPEYKMVPPVVKGAATRPGN